MRINEHSQSTLLGLAPLSSSLSSPYCSPYFLRYGRRDFGAKILHPVDSETSLAVMKHCKMVRQAKSKIEMKKEATRYAIRRTMKAGTNG